MIFGLSRLIAAATSFVEKGDEEMKIKNIIIIGAGLMVLGMILIFTIPVIMVQSTYDPFNPEGMVTTFFALSAVAAVCWFVGFFMMVGGAIYWFIKRPKKVIMVDVNGRPVQQNPQPTAPVESMKSPKLVKTVKAPVEPMKSPKLVKTVKCVVCKNTMKAESTYPDIRVDVVCPSCNTNGYVQF